MQAHPLRALAMGVLLAVCASGAVAQAANEIVLVKRPAELRDGPGEAARSLTPLALQTPLTRLTARQGAWIQVRTAAGTTGWVHMFDVGASGASATGSNVATGALRSISNFFNRGSAQGATSTATSTVGIRGLGAEDIAHAQPNMAALSQVDAMRQNAAQARKFAADAQLKSHAITPLPAPVVAASADPQSNPFKVP